ncbi:hypothetical protein MASSI9I_70069 [Massilia sp. 9I]|nr:hypothetical protein MASSI9I_70069 [Massilia sp. 9I]
MRQILSIINLNANYFYLRFDHTTKKDHANTKFLLQTGPSLWRIEHE